jgi:hypothetical protein
MKARSKKQPELSVPTERQMDEALDAFAKAKIRYTIMQVHERFVVSVLPKMMVGEVEFMGAKNLPPVTADVPNTLTITVKDFADEASARQWREREIIREAITAGMRAKP